MSIYSFTQTELLQGIQKLKAASSYQYGLWITERQGGDTTTSWRLGKIERMESVIFALQNFNYTYYNEEETINCLTVDETAQLLQIATQLAEECGGYTWAVTLPSEVVL